MSVFFAKIRSIFKLTAEDAFPLKFLCLACGREIDEGETFCEECRARLYKNSESTCALCGRHVNSFQTVCDTCSRYERHFDAAMSPFIYRGTAKRLILGFKLSDRRFVMDFLVENMVEKYRSQRETAEVILFIPMTKKEEKARGYNQSRLLAEATDKALSLPVCEYLSKVKETKPQRTLNGAARQENVKTAYRADKEVKGKTVLIVDDVMTTGATLSEAARVLKQKGAKRVICLTAAST